MKYFINIFLIIFSFLLCFLLGELFCRYLFFGKTDNFALGPGFKYWRTNYIKLNQHGFRDNEYSYLKSNNVFRILVLGDSFSFGFGLNDFKDTYPKLLENMLNQILYNDSYEIIENKIKYSSHFNYDFLNYSHLNNSKIKYEVINASFCGFNTIDEYNYFLNEGIKYKSDLLIVQFFLNDLELKDNKINTSTAILPKSIIYPDILDKYLTENSYLFYFIKYRINILFGLENNSIKYFIKLFDLDSKGWIDFNKSILGIQNLAMQNNISFILVIFPIIFQLDNYPFLNQHQQIINFCKNNNIKYIDLLESYKTVDESILRVAPFDTHPSILAHKLAAIEIYEYIKNNYLYKLY